MNKVNEIITKHNEKLDAMTEEERVAYYESFGLTIDPNAKDEEKHFDRIINEEYVKRRLRNGEMRLVDYHEAVQKDLNCIKAALEGSSVNYEDIPEDIKSKKWVANAYYTGYIKDQEKEDQEASKYLTYIPDEVETSYNYEELILDAEEDAAWNEYRETKRIQEEINESWKEYERENIKNQSLYPEYVLVQNAVYYAKENKENVLNTIIDVVSELDNFEYYCLKEDLTNAYDSLAIEFLGLNDYLDALSIDNLIDQERKNIRERIKK
ncbi:MAG: hypothetical protein IKX00_03370 [Bacilli bacterium]|nr:hypothetical protein [Bacilli bacterium]